MATRTTRNTIVRRRVSIFGNPTTFSGRLISTFEDVIKACLWENHELTTSRREPKWKDVKLNVISQLVDIWKKSSIPTVTNKRIHDMLDKYHAQYGIVLKPFTVR